MDEVMELEDLIYIEAKKGVLDIKGINTIKSGARLSNILYRSIHFSHIDQFKLIINNYNRDIININYIVELMRPLHTNFKESDEYLNSIVRLGDLDIIKECKRLKIDYRKILG